eukprot:COSAG04_NODE_1240_length_7596_cov_17.241697_7_plen_408_part_00
MQSQARNVCRTTDGRGHDKQGQCKLQRVCDAPTASAGSSLLHTGRAPPTKPERATPVGCHAQNGMIGGYSDLGGGDMAQDNHAHIVTMLEAVQQGVAAAALNISVSYNHGVHVGQLDTSGIGPAQTAANQSDLAIVVVGDSSEGVGYNGSASCGEGADRPSIDLAGVQLDLLDAVLSTGTPTIVVLVHGRPVSFGQDHGGAVTSKFGSLPLYMRMNALVAAWRPGVEGGHALWSLLTGAESFSGRLAQAWPHSGEHLQTTLVSLTAPLTPLALCCSGGGASGRHLALVFALLLRGVPGADDGYGYRQPAWPLARPFRGARTLFERFPPTIENGDDRSALDTWVLVLIWVLVPVALPWHVATATHNHGNICKLIRFLVAQCKPKKSCVAVLWEDMLCRCPATPLTTCT